MGFDRETLDVLDQAMEVDIETIKPNGMPQRTLLHQSVDRGEAFVRSWRGDHARWYQAALDKPDGVTLFVGDRTIPVRVVPAVDKLSINRCSRGLESKYAGDPSTPSMVRPSILGTTLRLEPRV